MALTGLGGVAGAGGMDLKAWAGPNPLTGEAVELFLKLCAG